MFIYHRNTESDYLAYKKSDLKACSAYTPDGHRNMKRVMWEDSTKTTWYTRDASGNILSTYTQKEKDSTNIFIQETNNIYGSSRVGVFNANKTIVTINGEDSSYLSMSTTLVTYTRGRKHYELSNHLGNVQVVLTDKRLPECDEESGITVSYMAEVISAYDYYPFGSPMEDRTYEFESYKFGFNGKEKDNEVQGGGNTYDYGFRIYNSRLGKFLSVDPLTKSYPWYTPYQFAGNLPIAAIDLDGLEEFIFHEETYENSRGQTLLYKVHWIYVNPNNRQSQRRGTFLSLSKSNFDIVKGNRTPPIITASANVLSKFNLGDEDEDKVHVLAYSTASGHASEKGINTVTNYSTQQSGQRTVPMNATIKFTTSETGSKLEGEFKDAFETLTPEEKNNLDNLVGALKHDQQATIDITGFATPKPVDFDGDGNATAPENIQLANSRAEKTKAFIVQYAKEKYGYELLETRINVKPGEVRDSTPNDGNNDNAEDRVTEIKLNAG